MSTSINVTVKGLGLTTRAIKNVDKNTRIGIIRGFIAIAKFLTRYARQSLKLPKHGKIYQRRGLVRRASAPWEPPASQTGTLSRSIKSTVDKESLELNFGASARYAKFLEFGTRKMLPRPFLRPAIDDNKPAIRQLMRNAIKRAIK